LEVYRSVPYRAAQEYYQDWSKDGKPSGKVANICLVGYALLRDYVTKFTENFSRKRCHDYLWTARSG